ncbi:MAG: hypothetical protein ACYC5O_03245 [Anaerolineae bacterium]
MSGAAALAGSIRESLDEVAQVVSRATALAERAAATGDDGYWC